MTIDKDAKLRKLSPERLEEAFKQIREQCTQKDNEDYPPVFNQIGAMLAASSANGEIKELFQCAMGNFLIGSLTGGDPRKAFCENFAHVVKNTLIAAELAVQAGEVPREPDPLASMDLDLTLTQAENCASSVIREAAKGGVDPNNGMLKQAHAIASALVRIREILTNKEIL